METKRLNIYTGEIQTLVNPSLSFKAYCENRRSLELAIHRGIEVEQKIKALRGENNDYALSNWIEYEERWARGEREWHSNGTRDLANEPYMVNGRPCTRSEWYENEMKSK